jgi:2-keto-myo-inositol isomerase
MKIALHELTSSKASFEEDLRAYREAGWTAFEMDVGKVSTYLQEHDLDCLARAVEESGLKPVAFSGHGVKAFASPADVEANEAGFRRTLDIMAAVACPVIAFGGDSPSEIAGALNMREEGLAERDRAYRAHLRRFAGQVAGLADMAKEKGVSMALEVNWCSLCRSVVTAAEVIEMTKRDNVGLLFDTAHFACSESRLSDLDRVKGRIVTGHLNDMRGCPPEVRNRNGDRLVPGDGVLPLVEWIAKAEECGYHGWHAVEIFSDDLWAEPPLAIAQKVMAGCKRLWPDAEF